MPVSTSDIYSEDYFSDANEGFACINCGAEEHAFGKYLDHIEKVHPHKGKLLDVGAATGTFLLNAKKRGWDVAGLEISGYASEQAQKEGLDVRTGTLEARLFEPQSFDVITMFDLLEHVPNPDQTIALAKNLLKPNGLLVLNLPDAGSVYAKLTGKLWPLIVPPEHLCLFNQKNLAMLLKHHDLDVMEIAKIGKRFKPAYILQVLYTVRYQKIWKKLADAIKDTMLNSISIPLNLRDNMFVIAKKQ